MKQKFIYQLLIVLVTILACAKEKSDSEIEGELNVYYQEINEVISVSGDYYIDIDGDLTDDYFIRLSHTSYNDPFINTSDTFYIEFGSLSDEYYYMDKDVDCVPCYEYYEPYETWSGSYVPYQTSSIISSFYVETGVEGKENAYLWLEKHEKSGAKDYYYTGWLRIKVSEKRDTLTIKDCAIELDRNMSLRIGEH